MGLDIAKGACCVGTEHTLRVHDLGFHEGHAFGSMQQVAVGFEGTFGGMEEGALELYGDHSGAALHTPGCIGHAHIHEGHQRAAVRDFEGVHVRIECFVLQHGLTLLGADELKAQKISKGNVDAKIFDKGFVPLLIVQRMG